MATEIKPLLIAEAANPEWVSVPLVGWSLARAIQQRIGAHIVTQIRNREAFIRAGLREGVDFTVLDSEKVARPLWRLGEMLRMGEGKGWTTAAAVSALGYAYFERLIWREFGDRISNGEFNIVHRITPLSPTANSPVAAKVRRAGVNFVLGPLNGGVPWPKGFDAERRQEREWLSYIRGAYKAMPGRTSTLKSANAIIVGSNYTRSEIPDSYQDKCIYIPENAIDPGRFSKKSMQSQDGPIRACFIGRLVPYKGPDMLLEAAAPFLRNGQMTLEVVGDGPLLNTLKDYAKTHGLLDTVTFHGWVSHTDVQDIAASCNVMTFPSIREFGGGVVLEAMALGVVPVIVDYAGPGELINQKTGFKVPIASRQKIIEEFQSTLSDVLANRGKLKEIAQTGQETIDHLFTWDRKAEQIEAVYRWLLDQPEQPAPVFDFPLNESNPPA